MADLPDVPTVAESGFRDYEHDAWYGMVVPAKTPAQLISQLSGWLTAALQTGDIKSKLATLGLYSTGLCGSDFAMHLRKQFDQYGRIIREAGIKVE
jgi:tripartite-type tricarboxylate transporter receptor subunit TctC